MRKFYTNIRTDEQTTTAREAMVWHRAGDAVEVLYLDADCVASHAVIVHGAPQPKEKDKNREHCRRIALDVEAYADGRIHTCPECGERVELRDDVGDKYKCPHCGEVNEIDYFEQLSLFDYFDDILDIEYVVDSRKQYKACRVMVAYGGPTIYIDTHRGAVCLYWWNESAEYPLLSDARNAIDEWAEEYYNMM